MLPVSACLSFWCESLNLLRSCTDRKDGVTVLGRIVVRDRIQVESKVLPKYFSHNSFASLRRQLNYFAFQRLGKGRQRESTYRNEAVIELDDILRLKRRPSGSSITSLPSNDIKTPSVPGTTPHFIGESTIVPIDSDSKSRRPSSGGRNTKRRRLNSTPPARRGSSPSLISEDEQDKTPYVALDLTQPPTATTIPDEDVLAGCTALLGLAAGW